MTAYLLFYFKSFVFSTTVIVCFFTLVKYFFKKELVSNLILAAILMYSGFQYLLFKLDMILILQPSLNTVIKSKIELSAILIFLPVFLIYLIILCRKTLVSILLFLSVAITFISSYILIFIEISEAFSYSIIGTVYFVNTILLALLLLNKNNKEFLFHIISGFVFFVVIAIDIVLNRKNFKFASFSEIGLVLYGFMIFIYDIKRFIRLTSDLKRTENKLEKLGTHHNQLISYTSEEVSTSLDSISNISKTLLEEKKGTLNDEQRSALTSVVSNTMRLSNLFKDIDSFSELKEKTIKLSIKPVNISKIIRYITIFSKPLLLGKKLIIKNNLPDNFPSALGDEEKIDQVFYNILEHSLKNILKGEVVIAGNVEEKNLNISISARGYKNENRIIEQLDKYFKKGDIAFWEEYNDLDIGLIISKKIIELCNGEIKFRTILDGIVFDITLPVNPGEEEKKSEEISTYLETLEEAEPILEENSSDENYKVLIVEDDFVTLQTMKKLLSLQNYKVVTVVKGDDAMEKIEEEMPDIIIIEIFLSSGISGYEACSQIRGNYSPTELPIILLTSRSKIANMMDGLASGANDFLIKPFNNEEFITRIKTHIQLSKLNSVYSRFVPKEFLTILGHKDIIGVKLGDQVQKEMTVLFVDIRAFTHLSENMTAQESFKFINSYLSRISPIIWKNNGFVDKFIGDSIMALYPDKPEDALKTAIEMVQNLKIYNKHRANSGYKAIDIGIGIHTGNLVLGIIGDDYRMQGTVISDAVNLASRIEDVTKLYGANIIISQDTFVQLTNPTEYNFRFLGRVRVKGKEKSVALFEIFDGDDENTIALKSETKTDFEKAILLFAKRDFKAAEALFSRIAETNKKDRAVLLFLDRTRKYLIQEFDIASGVRLI